MAENDRIQAPQLNPDLKSLNRMVGTWQVSGDATGQISYRWTEGGFFLVQEFDLLHQGRTIKGIELIGHLCPWVNRPKTSKRGFTVL